VLADPNALAVQSTVIEEDMALVQPGQEVNLFFDAQPDITLTGHVKRIVPQRDATSDRTAYPIVIILDQAHAGLLPGMTVDASIMVAQKAKVLRLPRSIVHAGPNNQATVQVWRNGQAVNRTVQVGLRGDLYVEIVSGVAEGDQVVGQ
jgi:multidrug efflux pump subunit AcrA (membrane-fusion protein)